MSLSGHMASVPHVPPSVLLLLDGPEIVAMGCIAASCPCFLSGAPDVSPRFAALLPRIKARVRGRAWIRGFDHKFVC